VQAFTIAGATAFGYTIPFTIVDDTHITFTVPALAPDPLQGVVPGDYFVLLISAIDYVNMGEFVVLAPGQQLPPPPGLAIDWIVNSLRPFIPQPQPWYGPGSGVRQEVPYGYAFWFDSPQHPCDDFAYWWDPVNWINGTWKWTQLTPASGWHVAPDPDHRHGNGTSLHGYILEPDNPASPAPAPPGYPPWPSVLHPAAPPPPAQPPNPAVALPSLQAGGPLPAPLPQAAPGPLNILDLQGTWYLDLAYLPDEHYRFTAIFQVVGGQISGVLQDEQGLGIQDPVTFNPAATSHYEFVRTVTGTGARAQQKDIFQVQIQDGVMSGVVFLNGAADVRHVSGWNQDHIDAANTLRVWEIAVNGMRARIRIDGQSPGTGRIRYYAATGGDGLEHDVTVSIWDGRQLVFSHDYAGRTYLFSSLKIDGRHILGQMFQHATGVIVPFLGVRVEVLSYGLINRGGATSAWRTATRKQLQLLMMGGDPSPSGKVTVSVANQDQDQHPWDTDRDDFRDTTGAPPYADPPGKYVKFKVVFNLDVVVPDFSNITGGTKTVKRFVHGCLAIPVGNVPGALPPVPRDDRPPQRAVVALNGHGTASEPWDWMNRLGGPAPGQNYWYADSFARYGYVALAIETVHRAAPDKGSDGDANHALYPNHMPLGYSSAVGFPSTKSTWADDGERVWDAVRGLNFILGNRDRLRIQPPAFTPQQQDLANAWNDFIDRWQEPDTPVSVVGHSMGGEVALMAGALEPAFVATVSAGNNNDYGETFPLDVTSPFAPPPGTHEDPRLRIFTLGLGICMQWTRANISEYVDLADFIALCAPRRLIYEAEHGLPVWRQQSRRGRIAYNEWNPLQGEFVEYAQLLENGVPHANNAHAYHAGMHKQNQSLAIPNVYVPKMVGTAASSPDLTWQDDPQFNRYPSGQPGATAKSTDTVTCSVFSLIP
jgi:dienelactone hydrolase